MEIFGQMILVFEAAVLIIDKTHDSSKLNGCLLIVGKT